jgi:hypothetical protein
VRSVARSPGLPGTLPGSFAARWWGAGKPALMVGVGEGVAAGCMADLRGWSAARRHDLENWLSSYVLQGEVRQVGAWVHGYRVRLGCEERPAERRE